MQREIRKLSQWISRTLHETADFPDAQQIKVNWESITTKYIMSSHSKPLKMLSSAGQFFISRLQWNLPCRWMSYINMDIQNAIRSHTPGILYLLPRNFWGHVLWKASMFIPFDPHRRVPTVIYHMWGVMLPLSTVHQSLICISVSKLVTYGSYNCYYAAKVRLLYSLTIFWLQFLKFPPWKTQQSIFSYTGHF